MRCRLTVFHDRYFPSQSEQKHFLFGIIPFEKYKAGNSCKTKPFAVKPTKNKMKHHAVYPRLVAGFATWRVQIDKHFSPLANDSTAPYRGSQSEKTSSWSGAKNDDSQRENKIFCRLFSYMLRFVTWICYIFVHKLLLSVNCKKPMDNQLTPEAMVKAILDEPRARTLMERLICETVR